MATSDDSSSPSRAGDGVLPPHRKADAAAPLAVWRERYPEKFAAPDEIFAHIHRGDRIFIGTGCGDPQHLVSELTRYVDTHPLAFFDTEVFHEGKASLRFEGFGRYEHGHARVMQELAVRPMRCYRVTCWVKTEGLVRGVQAAQDDDGRDPGRLHHPADPDPPPRQSQGRGLLLVGHARPEPQRPRQLLSGRR